MKRRVIFIGFAWLQPNKGNCFIKSFLSVDKRGNAESSRRAGVNKPWIFYMN